MEFSYPELTEQLERAYSPRLALRRIALSDGWPLFEATRNPRFNEHLLWDAPEDEFEVLRRIDAIADAARAGRLSAVSGIVRATGEWASLFRFQPYASDPFAMEIGVWTHDRFWAGAYTRELVLMAIDACFTAMPVDRLIGAASLNSKGSLGLMHAVGLTEAGAVKRRTESGRIVELQEFEITRETWMLQVARRGEQASHQIVPLSHYGIAQSGQAHIFDQRTEIPLSSRSRGAEEWLARLLSTASVGSVGSSDELAERADGLEPDQLPKGWWEFQGAWEDEELKRLDTQANINERAAHLHVLNDRLLHIGFVTIWFVVIAAVACLVDKTANWLLPLFGISAQTQTALGWTAHALMYADLLLLVVQLTESIGVHAVRAFNKIRLETVE